MAVGQLKYTKESGWSGNATMRDATLVFAFGEGEYFRSEECFAQIREFYPNAQIVGCSTSGVIMNSTLYDESVVVSAMDIDKEDIKTQQER